MIDASEKGYTPEMYQDQGIAFWQSLPGDLIEINTPEMSQDQVIAIWQNLPDDLIEIKSQELLAALSSNERFTRSKLQQMGLQNLGYHTDCSFRKVQKQILQEYAKLATLSELSEQEADRMGEILELAYSDEMLTLLINEIDDLIDQSQHLSLDDEDIKSKNQQARLKEFIRF